MIVIPRTLLKEIEAAAEAAYPEESCGLLIGYGKTLDQLTITRVEASENVFEGDKRKFFEVNPKLQFDLMRELRDSDLRIVGNFHSHPDSPAQPSDKDQAQVWDHELAWLITSIADGQAGTTNAFVFDAETRQFGDVELQTSG